MVTRVNNPVPQTTGQVGKKDEKGGGEVQKGGEKKVGEKKVGAFLGQKGEKFKNLDDLVDRTGIFGNFEKKKDKPVKGTSSGVSQQEKLSRKQEKKEADKLRKTEKKAEKDKLKAEKNTEKERLKTEKQKAKLAAKAKKDEKKEAARMKKFADKMGPITVTSKKKAPQTLSPEALVLKMTDISKFLKGKDVGKELAENQLLAEDVKTSLDSYNATADELAKTDPEKAKQLRTAGAILQLAIDKPKLDELNAMLDTVKGEDPEKDAKTLKEVADKIENVVRKFGRVHEELKAGHPAIAESYKTAIANLTKKVYATSIGKLIKNTLTTIDPETKKTVPATVASFKTALGSFKRESRLEDGYLGKLAHGDQKTIQDKTKDQLAGIDADPVRSELVNVKSRGVDPNGGTAPDTMTPAEKQALSKELVDLSKTTLVAGNLSPETKAALKTQYEEIRKQTLAMLEKQGIQAPGGNEEFAKKLAKFGIMTEPGLRVVCPALTDISGDTGKNLSRLLTFVINDYAGKQAPTLDPDPKKTIPTMDQCVTAFADNPPPKAVANTGGHVLASCYKEIATQYEKMVDDLLA